MSDGEDWENVPEGTEYTPEQAARKFLALPWELQVARMERFLEAAGEATACQLLNHEGSHIFATRHTCNDRYQEGFEAGKQALADHMARLADEMFAPKEEEKMSPRQPSQREYILSICADRGLVGRDAETAVDAYLSGYEDGADGGRVKGILKAHLEEVKR